MLVDLMMQSLTVAGLIFIVRYTDGPWDMFYNLRIKIGVYSIIDEQGNDKDFVDDTFLAKLVACHWCLATWVTLFGCIAAYREYFILYWFALVFMVGLLLEIVLLIRKYNG